MPLHETKQQRPLLSDISSAEVFLNWYWLKEEMVEFCKQNQLPISGRKFEVRDRIVAYFNGESVSTTPKVKKKSTFNWAQETLTLQTKITDNITFGKNLRGFMAQAIGPQFVCHSDFMDWVKSNVGASLSEAVKAWIALENRKLDKSFKRTIAPQNMLAQYARDFFQDNPSLTHKAMMHCWKNKKSLPCENGQVLYERTDRKWL